MYTACDVASEAASKMFRPIHGMPSEFPIFVEKMPAVGAMPVPRKKPEPAVVSRLPVAALPATTPVTNVPWKFPSQFKQTVGASQIFGGPPGGSGGQFPLGSFATNKTEP